MSRQIELIDHVKSYDKKADLCLIERAYDYATQKHSDQKRASGENYLVHPVEVANILAGMKLDSATIATALLHDTVEDTTATSAEISDLFGDEIASLVAGVTKFTLIERGASEEHKRAENFKKLLLATAGDVRVLLVKLADRLHNMRTLKYLNIDKRTRISEETMSVYAPLAGRMGMQAVREELEDLAFGYINPRARKMIRERIRPLVRKKGELFHNIADELMRKFVQHGISAQVSWRMKQPWSIWKKMEQKSIFLEQLSDLMGFRVIVENVEDCYRALGVIHTTWQSVPKHFKDYISTAKPNGYQSIHSTVIGPKKQRIELQIRTQLMHERAEYGISAHWRYKEGGSDKSLTAPFNWLREVVEMLEHGSTAQEFLEHTKMDMLESYLFCFTIKGRLIVLPQNAIPLDFAYALHTDIGNSYKGAKVNGRLVAINHALQDGDQVEIVRDKNAQPRPLWEGIVKTGKAKSEIRRALRKHKQEALRALGFEILTSIFSSHNKKISQALLERALGPLKALDVDDILRKVALSEIKALDVFDAVYPQARKGLFKNQKWRPMLLFGRKREIASNLESKKIPISGPLESLALEFAKGFFPVPGDPIVGILTPGKGIVIYPLKSKALSAFEIHPDRWVSLDWNIENNSQMAFWVRVIVQVAHEIGTLATLTALIAEYQSNIDRLGVISADTNFRKLYLDIEVRDLDHVNKILTALKGLSLVHHVERVLESDF